MTQPRKRIAKRAGAVKAKEWDAFLAVRGAQWVALGGSPVEANDLAMKAHPQSRDIEIIPVRIKEVVTPTNRSKRHHGK